MSYDTTITYLTVEGIGTVISSADHLYRWSTETPTSAANDVYVPCVAPNIETIQSDLDLVAGDASFGGLGLSMAAVGTALAEFCQTYVDDTTALSADLEAAETSVSVTATSGLAADDLIWIERECMLVVSIDGASSLTAERGALSTLDTWHPQGARVHLSNPILRGRRVSLYTTDLDESPPSLIWAGVLDGCYMPDPAQLQLQAQSGGVWLRSRAIYYPWVGRLQGAVAYSRSGLHSQYAAPVGDPEEKPAAWRSLDLASDSPSTLGPCCVIKIDDTLYRGLAYDSGTTVDAETTRRYQVLIQEGEPLDGDPVDPGDMLDATEVLTTRYPSGAPFRRYTISGGAWTDTSNPFLLTLIWILSDGSASSTNPGGTNYTAGVDTYSYSVLPNGYGAAVPRPLVDVPAFEAAAARLSIAADRLVVTPDDTVEDVCKRLLWPLGYMVVTAADGTLTPVRLSDSVGASTVAIVQGDLDATSQVTYHRQLELIFGQGSIDWGDGSDADLVLSDVTSRWYRNLADTELDVDASAYDRSTHRRVIQEYLIQLADRLSFPPPLLEIKVAPTVGSQLSVGSRITITHTALVDADGTRGVVTIGGYVVAETLSVADAGAKDLQIWYTSHDIGTTGVIHWTARVVYYDPTTRTVTIDADYWSGSTDTLPSSGDRVVLVSSDLTSRSSPGVQQVEATTVSGSAVVLDHGFVADDYSAVDPRAGDMLIGVGYDSADNSEPDTYIYLADDTPTVGTAGDDPYEVVD